MNKSEVKNDFLSSTVASTVVINHCSNIAAKSKNYNIVVRSIPRFPDYRSTSSDWRKMFGQEMPRLSKINKITDALSPDTRITGSDWVVPGFVRNHKNTLHVYVSIGNGTQMETQYFVGDRMATDEEYAFITDHLRTSSSTEQAGQKKTGRPEHVVLHRCFKLSNVVSITQSSDVVKKVNSTSGLVYSQKEELTQAQERKHDEFTDYLTKVVGLKTPHHQTESLERRVQIFIREVINSNFTCVYDTNNTEFLESVIDKIEEHIDWNIYNRRHARTLTSSLKHYIDFVKAKKLDSSVRSYI